MGKPLLEEDDKRSSWVPIALAMLLAAGMMLVVAVSVAIAAWKLRSRTPRSKPFEVQQVQTITFQKLDGSDEQIQLTGQSTKNVGEQLFWGFREVAAEPSSSVDSAATWNVTIELVSGQLFSFTARDNPAGDVWTAGGVTRAVQGDVELVLNALPGIVLFDRRNDRDWQETEKLAARLGDEDIDHLLALFNSPDEMQRGIALLALNQVVSPGLRREQRMPLFIDPRNTPPEGSPNDHPRAADVRAAALKAFDEWNQGKLSVPGGNWLRTGAFQGLYVFADQSVADHLAAALRARPNADHHAESIMSALEHSYALAPLREPQFYCPTGETKENIARAAAKAQQSRNERRDLILAWHDEHRSLPREEHLAAAVLQWDARIAELTHHYINLNPSSAVIAFGPLVSQGPAVVPFIRKAQEKATDLPKQAIYELIIALASGKHDPALVERLGKQPGEGNLAQKIREISVPETLAP